MLSRFEGDASRALDVETLMSILAMRDPKELVVLEGCDCCGFLGGISSETDSDGETRCYLLRTRD